MSFQGDVAGIGLANLLQSLARGRVGVLTLKSSDGRHTTLGLQGGSLHLLPEPGEDADIWRLRVRRAWARDPESGVDSLRMAEVARAVRLENLYRLLDSSEVHFRFNPGPLPERPASAASQHDEAALRGGTAADAVFVNPIQLEALLLEFARLGDELERIGGAEFVTEDVVPVPLVARDSATERYFGACDGQSTLVEIGDRLSWTIRQVRLVTLQHIHSGVVRLAEPHELLGLAAMELQAANPKRAGSRLHAWSVQSLPGPMGPEEAQFLAEEWSAGHLQEALRSLPMRVARTLLRRLDHGLRNPGQSALHWQAYAEDFKSDVLGKLHVMACQVRGQADPNLPTLRDLLTIARQMREAELPMRAGVFLRIAAGREVESLAQQLEIGQGLLAVGLVPEAVPWIQNACGRLIERGQPENAVLPLRELVSKDRANRDARRLLSRARTQAMRKRITRKHAVIAVAIAVVISTGAWVQVRLRRDYEGRVDKVEALLESPAEGLALLDAEFEGDASERVASLRQALFRRARQIDDAQRSEWTDLYAQVQVECTLGDVLLGLDSALALPLPPALRDQGQPWPDVANIYDGLCARLEGELAALGEELGEEPLQEQGEAQLGELVDALLSKAAAVENDDVAVLGKRLAELRARIDQRAATRAEVRAERERDANLALQDRLLATARSHVAAGDLPRALEAYARLVEVDPTKKLAELLQREIAEAERRHEAIVGARELAASGRHGEARGVLEQGLGQATGVRLPWRLDSFPSAALVRFADGSTHETPLELETRFGETLAFTLEAAGYEPLPVSFDQPANRFLYLSRTPEFAWRGAGRVDAPPVAVGEDHVVADRSGRIQRVGRDGSVRWERQVPTLSGIARAPVFLPKRPGHLLFVTEDGEAWIVAAEQGSADGPWSVGSPPFQGPLPSGDAVTVAFANGERWSWTAQLKPVRLAPFVTPEGEVEGRYGSDVGLAVLRRRAGSDELDSPWTRSSVSVGEQVFNVRAAGESEPWFTVARTGEWTWIAWEAPSARLAQGRLWIADEAGLRSFLPP